MNWLVGHSWMHGRESLRREAEKLCTAVLSEGNGRIPAYVVWKSELPEVCESFGDYCGIVSPILDALCDRHGVLAERWQGSG